MNQLQQSMLNAVETELKRQVGRLAEPRTAPFYEMLTYHMGWSGEGAGTRATGKRIRPLILLLCDASIGKKNADNAGEDTDWLRANPAAAAVELVHNFSLVHDDIQDKSHQRRGRKTVWTKWGSPMAINVGDALFVIANQAALDLKAHYPAEVVVRVAEILSACCLDLTRGQFLDMSYEKRYDLTLNDYWTMIGGKTSALLSACAQIGAILGNADETQIELYRRFGYNLGLAFQTQDDILGIWGDEALTGKSSASDLAEGKNSLPILYALERNGKFAERWRQGSIAADEVSQLATLLDEEDAKNYAENASAELTQNALDNLQQANPQGAAGEALFELTKRLLKRDQ
ncbi:MAG: polyprenyl synthetase family protein [Anaerolineales bacterium]|nr:polyprenyl synthetase family protein [Anaerolineales bacterium]